MDNFFLAGAQLRSFLHGLAGPSSVSEGVEDESTARLRRENPQLVPGSRHYASVLAYGNFILHDGTGANIRCEAIQGISGVVTLREVTLLASGHPQVRLQRFLTHFQFDDPAVLIEQNPLKESTGTLTGVTKGEPGSLLPGRGTFSRHIILSLAGRPLANRDPLVMTAERVDQWPPIGSSFVSERPTDFYDLAKVDDPNAKAIATLSACNVVATRELTVPAG